MMAQLKCNHMKKLEKQAVCFKLSQLSSLQVQGSADRAQHAKKDTGHWARACADLLTRCMSACLQLSSVGLSCQHELSLPPERTASEAFIPATGHIKRLRTNGQ